jgi:hypothetical protein
MVQLAQNETATWLHTSISYPVYGWDSFFTSRSLTSVEAWGRWSWHDNSTQDHDDDALRVVMMVMAWLLYSGPWWWCSKGRYDGYGMITLLRTMMMMPEGSWWWSWHDNTTQVHDDDPLRFVMTTMHFFKENVYLWPYYDIKECAIGSHEQIKVCNKLKAWLGCIFALPHFVFYKA